MPGVSISLNKAELLNQDGSPARNHLLGKEPRFGPLSVAATLLERPSFCRTHAPLWYHGSQCPQSSMRSSKGRKIVKKRASNRVVTPVKSTISAPKEEIVTTLQPLDVIMGRGVFPTEYEGNKRLRKLVEEHLQAYVQTKKNKVKQKIALAIVTTVTTHGGRFLRRLDPSSSPQQLVANKQGPLWQVVGDRKVMLGKVKQLFRDAGPEARLKRKLRKRKTPGVAQLEGKQIQPMERKQPPKKIKAVAECCSQLAREKRQHSVESPPSASKLDDISVRAAAASAVGLVRSFPPLALASIRYPSVESPHSAVSLPSPSEMIPPLSNPSFRCHTSRLLVALTTPYPHIVFRVGNHLPLLASKQLPACYFITKTPHLDPPKPSFPSNDGSH